MGHKDVSTTMIYTHVLQQGGHGVKSPLDDLTLLGTSSPESVITISAPDVLSGTTPCLKGSFIARPVNLCHLIDIN